MLPSVDNVIPLVGAQDSPPLVGAQDSPPLVGAQDSPRKRLLAILGMACIVACFLGFAPALAYFVEKGSWKLDAFYGCCDYDTLLLRLHAPLGYLWLLLGAVQVLLGAGLLPGKQASRVHRVMGYTAVAPLAVVMVGTGMRNELDAFGVLAIFHLSTGSAALLNLGLALRAGRAGRFREHAEYAGYFVIVVTQPGWARFASFLLELAIPCGLDGFSGGEAVSHTIVASLLLAVMRARGRLSTPWGLAGNVAFLVLYGVGTVIYALTMGNFFRCAAGAAPRVWP